MALRITLIRGRDVAEVIWWEDLSDTISQKRRGLVFFGRWWLFYVGSLSGKWHDARMARASASSGSSSPKGG
jgi:hypothetical protein